MILLDSTVVIAYLRSPTGRLRALFQQHSPAISGITRAEVLHGARDAAHLAVLIRALDQFVHEELNSEIWDHAGRNLCLLRLRGVTVPFADAVIATLAIEGGMELWTYDSHFTLIQTVLPTLRLFIEPP